jgi:hypothetical protein
MKKILALFLLFPSLAFGQAISNPYAATLNLPGGGTDVTNYLTLEVPTNAAGHKTWVLPNSYGTANYFLQTDGSGNLTWAAGSGGTVTSIGVTVPSFLSVSPATITTSGTFTITLATKSANLVFAGPTSGGAATPTFRSLVAGDLPGGSITNTVTNSDGTLTISPTSGAVVASLALSHANSWTGAQTFGMHNYTETTPTALAANTNNYAIETTNSMVYLTASSAVNLTGIAAGTDGQTYFLINNGTHAITLTDRDAGSSASNQFLFFSGNKILEPNAIIMIIYDGTSATKGWRCITPN